jgi:uncharacterized protein with HEPN domain
MRDDAARLLDIVLACREAQEYTKGISRAEFQADRKLQRALCMLLEIIGEAARAISEPFKAAHPDVPWPHIVGLRNRIVHEYFRLDLDVLWEIAQRDVPRLLALLRPLAPPETPPHTG